MKKTASALLLAMVLTVFSPVRATAIEHQDISQDTEYIVKLKEKSSDSARLMSMDGLSELNSENGVYVVKGEDNLQNLGNIVEYSETNEKAHLCAMTNDPYINSQWDLPDTEYSSAYQRGYDGEGVRVAIIDSGIHYTHEDFEHTNIETGFNTSNNTNNTNDMLGHGTFVASTIAATTNNNKGIAGLCSKATIIPIKCFEDSKDTDLSLIIKGIYCAVDDYHCDVINLSLGTETDSQFLRDAVNHAVNSGTIVVAAVGNDGKSTINYPAAYNNVVGVGSYNENGEHASFSQYNNSVYVSAPGAELVGAGRVKTKPFTDQSYVIGGGTSYSTPIVSAAAIMLKQFDNNATNSQFMDLIKRSSVDAGQQGYDIFYGWGKLNFKNYIELMEKTDPSTSIPTRHTFDDMKGHWAEKHADFCYDKGLFEGDEYNNFMPDAIMNRAMFATVLGRLSGEKISGYTNVFADVEDNSWYAQSCAWGNNNGYINGVGYNRFMPFNPITREQLVTMLYRYSQKNNLLMNTFNTNILNNFGDDETVSDYAKEAMLWAVGYGIITGREGNLCPQAEAPRAEVAVIASRYCNVVE